MTSNSLAMQSQDRAAGSASALLGLIPLVLGAIAALLVGIAEGNTTPPMAIVIAICNMDALICYEKLVR